MIATIAGWLFEAKRVIAFTGAGISTESGIPDFRSPGGVWSQSQPVYFDEFLASEEARHEYWRQKSATHSEFADALPNLGHRLLAQWEATERLRGVITQNIDGLHQIAGSRNVIELHGTARKVGCLDCHEQFEADALVAQFLADDAVPLCPQCGTGRLKHATISFGQALDNTAIEEAADWAAEADVMLVLGSSLVVYPAASIPQIAQQAGARLIIINRDPTPFDSTADLVMRAPLGETLQAIDRELSRLAR